MALQEELEKEGNWLFRYRSYLPIILLLIGIAIPKHLVFMDGTYYEYACLLVSLSGIVIRIYTVGYTPANTSGRNTQRQIAARLNTTGIYSIVRHPLYLGNFFIYSGIALLTSNPGFILVFFLLFWLYYERIIYAEEQFLQRKFGNKYQAWATHTPAFIPKFSLFQASTIPFSWKKVIKKEKNGIFALLLVFCIFDLTEARLQHLHTFNMPLLTATFLSGLVYIVLKIIKKHTSLLDEKGR